MRYIEIAKGVACGTGGGPVSKGKGGGKNHVEYDDALQALQAICEHVGVKAELVTRAKAYQLEVGGMTFKLSGGRSRSKEFSSDLDSSLTEDIEEMWLDILDNTSQSGVYTADLDDYEELAKLIAKVSKSKGSKANGRKSHPLATIKDDVVFQGSYKGIDVLGVAKKTSKGVMADVILADDADLIGEQYNVLDISNVEVLKVTDGSFLNRLVMFSKNVR